MGAVLSRRLTHLRVNLDTEELPFPRGSVVEVLSGVGGNGPVKLAGLHWTGVPTTYELSWAEYRKLRRFVLVQQEVQATTGPVS